MAPKQWEDLIPEALKIDSIKELAQKIQDDPESETANSYKDQMLICINPEVYSDLSELQRELQTEFHIWRAMDVVGARALVKNIPQQTHSIVTEAGLVTIIRKPTGRVLGQVMSKIGAFSKDPDYYAAGSIILDNCQIYMDPEAEKDEDAQFAIRMAAIGVVEIQEHRLKKN